MNDEQISAEQLKKIIDNGLDKESIIVDVRTPAEFSRGAITGAINIPVDNILNELDQLKDYKTIYVYCLSGGRSSMAQSDILSSGFAGKVLNLTSGMMSWRKNGFPTV